MFSQLMHKFARCVRFIAIAIFTFIFTILPGRAVTLGWNASPDPTVNSYTVSYGVASGSYATAIEVGNVLSAAVTNLTPGVTYYFVVTARNAAGLDSDPSNEIAYTVPGSLPPNLPPTLNTIGNVALNEDAGSQTVTLSGISAGGTEVQALSVSASSSNPSLIPNPNVNYTSPGSTGSLRFAPAANASGSAIITVTVDDGQAQSNTVSRSFVVTVNPVNDPPTLNAPGNLLLPANPGPQTVSLSGIGSGAANESQTLVVTASHNNPALLSGLSVAYTSPAVTGTLNITPIAGASGTATVTVSVNDGGASNNVVTRVFTISVATNAGVTLFREAESGVITAPMQLESDSAASNGQCAYSPTTDTGTMQFDVNLPQAGTYLMWCRVLSPDPMTDSFYVSVDGGAQDIYDTVPNTWSSNWQWSRLNGRVAGTPRLLTLGAGTHRFVFQAREAMTRLDAFYLTSDGSFDPNQAGGSNPSSLIYAEAESSTITAPMTIFADSNAAGGRAVYSLSNEAGTASFTLSLPQAGDYVVWCRVLSPDAGTDSFYVAVDGGAEDVYFTALNAWSSAWQWSQLNGQAAGSPRVLSLSQGAHTLVFRSREAYTGLDALYVTTDRNFVPGASGNPQPANQPPSVNAGPDTSVTLPSSLRLAGVVTDDGLPNPPGVWTATWSKVSGPGVVTFTAPGLPGTTATFSVAGQYVLRLTANDGTLTASDDMVVTVVAAPDVTGPVVSAFTVAGLDARTATFSWNTDEPGQCALEYGFTSSLGSSSTLETTRGTNHQGALINLRPGTPYYVRIRSVDAAGNVSFSATTSLSTPPVNVFAWAAEDGELTAPMALRANATALNLRCLSSPSADAGAANFPVEVAVTSDYRLWCRLTSPAAGLGSFYVSVDGAGEALFDTADTGWTNGWQWVAVNARVGAVPLAMNPRYLHLEAGLREILFRTHEAGVLLDELVLSNDPDWVPAIDGTAPRLTATAVATNQINLVWTDDLNDEDGFRVEWSTDASNFVALVTLPAGSTSYQHTGLAGFTTYYYRVYGFNASDRTDPSNVASARTATPAAPSNLSARILSQYQVQLTWTDRASDEAGFVVERSVDGVNFAVVKSVGQDVTSMTDTLTFLGRYFYRVRALNSAGRSAPSNVVNVRLR